MTDIVDPPWIIEAKKHLGLSEIPGPKHAPDILAMWKAIKRGGIKDDETAWCAAFAGSSLEEAGIESTRFESAKSYLNWGIPITQPIYGCIVILGRDGGGGGHVGFGVGQFNESIIILGGNQKNRCCYASFSFQRVLGYRWPHNYPQTGPLPTLTEIPMSTSEA